MKRFILALALLPGCGMMMPVYLIDARPADMLDEDEHPFDRINAACDFWGITCYDTDDERGALSVFLVHAWASTNQDDNIQGQSVDRVCTPFVWADGSWSVPVVEHEIGHAIGELDHSDYWHNVMYKHTISDSAGATDDQRDSVQTGVDLLSACLGNG